MTINLHPQSATATPDTSMAEFETYCGLLAEQQRGILWQIGDMVIEAKRRWPDTWQQVFPEWVSPDQLSRCEAVSKAYKPEERNILATWAIHMQNAKKPDRVVLVQAHVDAGHTSDEARRNPAPSMASKTDWLLAVDVNGFVCSYFFGGSGIQAAETFAGWLHRLIDRLKHDKGLTDVVCCLDSHTNFRKELTKDWEHPYKKSRVEKEEELSVQLKRAPELLRELNLPCVTVEGMEADDVIASYAVQFPGRVTVLSKDKDMRQCLSEKCNLLKDAKWDENSETGSFVPAYEWVTAKSHTEEGMTYSGVKVVGITPEMWPHFQAIAGDSTDNVKGVEGIGAQGAMDLIRNHGTVDAVIAACKDGTATVGSGEQTKPLSAIKTDAVLAFEPIKDITMQLVTLRTDLKVPMVTKLAIKEVA